MNRLQSLSMDTISLNLLEHAHRNTEGIRGAACLQTVKTIVFISAAVFVVMLVVVKTITKAPHSSLIISPPHRDYRRPTRLC